MYVNSGYLYNTRVPIKDKSKPLLVGSCGTYRLRTKQKLPTWRCSSPSHLTPWSP